MILVCEDDASLRELIRTILQDEFEISEAADGQEAIDLARTLRPKLIVLDIMLPGRSGLEVLEELRSSVETDTTPVLAISAWDEVEDQALAAGADAFLRKPFNPDELALRVRELVDYR